MSHALNHGASNLLEKKKIKNVGLFGLIRKNPETYPLAFFMGCAFVLVAGTIVHEVRGNPDGRSNRKERRNTIRHNEEDGKRWIRHHETLRHPIFGKMYVDPHHPNRIAGIDMPQR